MPRALALRSLYHRALQWARTGATRWLANASYGRKWLALGALIGLVSGFGAVIFIEALKLSTHLLIDALGGYRIGSPVAEGNTVPATHFMRPWAIPLIACGGALVAAILVYTIAPDAEGHGTDAAIAAVHHNPRGIRMRTVAVKIVASALTIGSGGSAGREGPTGQISAGFGSLFSRFFDLGPSDARVAVASGIGSGIGSIFGAPLAGTVLAAEIMYRDDFESEALVPAFIASIVGYAVWGTFEGFGPLFGYVGNFHLTNALQLIWFAAIGLVGGAVGLLYAKGFYGLADLFERLPLARWLRPALGGLLVGLIGLAIPEVLGTGYGWIQVSLGRSLLAVPLWVVVLVPFARILTTGLSVGSGGSGGIFGPGMVIGAFIGAAWWRLLEPILPSLGHSPAPYVIVGMMACFGSISRAPFAVMLMVTEMTGNFSLIVPAMVAVGLATLIVRRNDDSIYRSQLRSRADSPAHRLMNGLPLLALLRVANAMRPPRLVVHDHDLVRDARSELDARRLTGAPLVDADGRYLGVASRERLGELDDGAIIADTNLADGSVAPVREDLTLDSVLETFASWNVHWLTVVNDDRVVLGTIAGSDLVRSYRVALRESIAHASVAAESSGVLEIVINDTSPLVGASLNDPAVPRGVLVTAITRGADVFNPSHDAVFAAGDRLSALGGADDLGELRRLAEGPSL